MNGLPEQSPELLALAGALDGRPAPCMTGDPDAWFEDPDEAAKACIEDCHALDQCRALALSIRPSAGVWAGVDWERKPRRKRSA